MTKRLVALLLPALLASVSTALIGPRVPASVSIKQDQALPSVSAPTPHDTAPPPPRADNGAPSTWFTRLDIPGLHNVFLCPRAIYSGAAPEGDAGFDAIKELGVRTIISVDGLAPDVTPAEARGMRYVHLPIGYDGFPHQQGMSLARALRDLPGPIYVHCHHGRHRSPAAVAFALAVLGDVDSCAARELLEAAGTSPSYAKLFDIVDRAEVVAGSRLDAHDCEFPPLARLSTLTETMAQAGLVAERLEACRLAGWAAPREHPDVVAANEAVMLAELLRATSRSVVAEGTRSQAFLDLLKESEIAAGRLSDALGVSDAATCSDAPRVSGIAGDPFAARGAGTTRLDGAARGADASRAEQAYLHVTASCQGCHEKYRR